MTEPGAPATLDAFHVKMASLSGQMPKRLRQCAEFIDQNSKLIAISTVAELAKAADVQPSAFMRFCQIMGFSGYSEMQRMYRENYGHRWPDYATRLETLRAKGEDSPTALLAEFVDAGRASLRNLANEIEPELLEDAVSSIAAAPMIHIVGYSRAFPVATYLAYAFEKMSIPAMLHAGFGKLDNRHAIHQRDVLIAISFRPYSQETVEMADFAKSRCCNIVSLTDRSTSPLALRGATVLTIPEVDVESFRALTAPQTLAISIAVAVGSRRETNADDK